MAKVISVGIQKGGVGKSTTSTMLAYTLSKTHKVLAVDMDSQGNFTQLLTGRDDIFEFKGTIYDAIKDQDASNYIRKITENLHILCGDENVSVLSEYFYIDLKKKYQYTLKNALEKVADNYDYIIIDNPPALGELSIISLTASDYVLVMFETSKFCYNSLKSYMDTITRVQKRSNPNLKIAGILRNIIDKRRSDSKYYSKLVKEEYGDLCLDTIITRSAVVGRLSSFGVFANSEIKKIEKEYNPFIKEFMGNVKI